MFPNNGFYTSGSPQLPGVDDRRTPALMNVIALESKDVPFASFPMYLWQQQAARMIEYWNWFNGAVLNEARGQQQDGKPILKYPLGINPVRNFARKHASLLLGEENSDSPQPLVRCRVTPKNNLSGVDTFTDEQKSLATVCQNIVNTVWQDSNGRALQMENALLSQFLGGSVFQIAWQPWRADELQIPIIIKSWPADFFIPIYRSDNYWDLLEAFLVYRIPNNVAIELYGKDLPDVTGALGWSTYCEHWTRTEYSITINGKYLTSSFSGIPTTYDHKPNPFGIVPFIYIPHVREGNFYGSSIVEDVRGLTKELNARMADEGDAIRETVHRIRYMTDVTGQPKPIKLGDGVSAINLGNTAAATKITPDVWTEDPPQISEALTGFTRELWLQLLREGSMGTIAFGEDEGSQRSALTLAFRMWPSTAHARMERTYWTDGLNAIAKMILKICVIKAKELPGISVPKDFQRQLNFSQAWLPMIPRDREEQVNEAIFRFQSNLISPERALKMLGDTEYIDDEIAKIKEWMDFQSKLEAAASAGSSGTQTSASSVVTAEN